MNTVYRARRYCNNSSPAKKRRRVGKNSQDEKTTNDNDSNVVIEVRNPDGKWSLHHVTTNEDANPSRQEISTDEVIDFVTQGELVENGSARDAPTHDDSVDFSYPGVIGMSPSFISFNSRDFISGNWLPSGGNDGISQSMDPSLMYPGPQFSQSLIQPDIDVSDMELVTSLVWPSDLSMLPFGTTSVEDLPFHRFERQLELRRLISATYPSPTQDSGLFGTQNLIALFVTEAATAMAEINGNLPNANLSRAWLTLQTLDSVLPKSQQGRGSNLTTRPTQELQDIEIHRLLLFSTANGFLGLDGIPIETVLRFLTQTSNITPLLSRLFGDSPGPVAKSLAENLFRAAIEAGDHKAVKLLLQTRLVDANNTICFAGETKYTPLERAAKLQRLKVVHELLRSKPNVNRTLRRKPAAAYTPDLRGALGCLIEEIVPKKLTERNHSPFSDEYLSTVDSLIQEGAKVRHTFIEIALGRFVRMDLARKLLRTLAAGDHTKAMSKDILPSIAEELTDDAAHEAITKIISDCALTSCNKCLTCYSDEINWAIVVGAKRGLVHLVRSFLQHTKSLSQLLSAAISGGNSQLIEFLLAQNPNIRRDPAENIQYPPWHHGFEDTLKTTPLAEAVDAGDQILIKRLENEGALEYLEIGGRFEAVLAASSKAGSFEYVKKLLFLTPGAEGENMEIALLNAVKYHREDVARILLHSGVILKGDWRLDTQLLIDAYEWGNEPFLHDLMLTFPGLKLESLDETLRETLVSGNLDMFNFFYRSGRLSPLFLGYSLPVAVSRNDSEMLHLLLVSGADVAAIESSGETITKLRPNMLRPMLEHVSLLRKAPGETFGHKIIKEAIERNPCDIEMLEMILGCTAIDPTFIRKYYHTSPLGLAIMADTEGCRFDYPSTTRLLDVGCDIDGIVRHNLNHSRRRINETPLVMAIRAKNKNIVQLLISRGANVNKKAAHGIVRTPLQAAAEAGTLDIVELLLQNGAGVNDEPASYSGGTSLQCAAMGGNCNIAFLLLGKGANLDATPSMFDGRWPIEGAAEHGRLDMIQLLWNASIVGFPLEQCRKAMQLAQENGHGACRDLIRELAVSNGIMPTLEGSG